MKHPGSPRAVCWIDAMLEIDHFIGGKGRHAGGCVAVDAGHGETLWEGRASDGRNMIVLDAYDERAERRADYHRQVKGRIFEQFIAHNDRLAGIFKRLEDY